MPPLLLWEIERFSEDHAALHRPVTLHYKDSNDPGVKELRIETPDREHIATIVDVAWNFGDDGVWLRGYVNRPRRRADPLETWIAKPILDDESGPVPWRVEIVLSTSGETIVMEPALVQEHPVTQDASGKVAALRDLGLDWTEWAAAEKEADYKLLIEPDRVARRWISDYDIR